MSEPTVVAPREGEVIGDAPDRRVEILSDHEALHATWSRFGPGRDGADLHIHRRHTDLFYVLQGELTVRLGPDDERAAPKGTLVRVPPFVVHGFRNGADEELRYLNFHAPGQGFADYMRGLRDGTRVDFDQEDPPDDGTIRPATEAALGETVVEVEQGGSRLRLLADVEELAVAHVTSDGDSGSPPLHVHDEHAESFYVLTGELVLTAEDEEIRAREGTWVQIPAGVAHTFAVDGPTEFLSVHAPNRGFGAFARALDDGTDPARSGFDERPVE